MESKFQQELKELIKNEIKKGIDTNSAKIEDEIKELKEKIIQLTMKTNESTTQELEKQKLQFEEEKNNLILKSEEEKNALNMKINELNKKIEYLMNEIELQKPYVVLGKQKILEIEENNKKRKKQSEIEENEKIDEQNAKKRKEGENSLIISEEQKKILEKYISETLKETDNSKKVWELRYRGTEDGFSSKDFHSKCDVLNFPTITIVETTNGSVFGGFTTKNWDSVDHHILDSNSFIFSIFNSVNPSRAPIKIPCSKCDFAIYCHPNYGPTFGKSGDICLFFNLFAFFFVKNSFISFGDKKGVYTNSNVNLCSYTNLNDSYDAGMKFESDEAKNFFCGSYRFTTSQCEVFSIE